jgi:hypothetical protein
VQGRVVGVVKGGPRRATSRTPTWSGQTAPTHRRLAQRIRLTVSWVIKLSGMPIAGSTPTIPQPPRPVGHADAACLSIPIFNAEAQNSISLRRGMRWPSLIWPHRWPF